MENYLTNNIENNKINKNYFLNDKPIFCNIFKPFLYKPIKIGNLQNLDQTILFSKNFIFYSFNNKKFTKFLQKSLINASNGIINYIVTELKGNFRDVIKNINGNYFCSNLINVCGKNNRIKILNELSNKLNEYSIDKFANHPIQSLIELASTEDEFKLILASFNEYKKILIASLNHNGTYVIQKIIRHIPESLRKKFNSIFVKLVSILSIDIYGVFSLEIFIIYTKDEIIRTQTFNIIMKDFITISTNKVGNYVIQILLLKWLDSKNGELLKKLIKSNFSILSTNIYSVYICQLYDKLYKNNEENEFCSSLNTQKNFL